ncbi:MAG TPA: NADPH:quinone oxidoreductase family protein [Acidimicrobiales bacterium]|jgi:NADPH2:quinone reductase|nr:NADPH:quinone oxidoreductase family protein [Acidimicrobiales bacterium]
MRAWRVDRPGEPSEVLRLVDAPVPEPGPGQIRVRVTAAGIGLPDVLMCRHTYPLTPPGSFIPGQEGTGVVSAVGPDVDVALGTKVMSTTSFMEGSGSFAEEYVTPAQASFTVPSGLGDVDAAGFWIPNLTAWIGLVDRARLEPGEWLAVIGAAGGSGIAAVQLGRALGARVVAVVSDEARAEYCRHMGADEVLNYRDGDLAGRLRQMTDGHGVDAVYDPVGGPVAEEVATALARHGRLLAVGFASGSWARIKTINLVVTNTSLVGVYAGDYRRDELDAIHAELSNLVSSGRLQNAVTTQVPFDDLPSALQRLADRSVIGKMVMVW